MNSALRHFEDFRSGEIIDLGQRSVTRDEIVTFAAEFDPQPMHLDEAAGAKSLLGGLGASGWHTASLLMRQLVDGLLATSAGSGSPGIDRLSWLSPVRPGDVLRMSGEVLETRRSSSRPEIGIVRFRFNVVRDDGSRVLEMEGPLMFRSRTGGAS